MDKVFITHSRNDAPILKHIHQLVNEAGVSPIFYKYDHGSIDSALTAAQTQISALTQAGIKVSLGDAKVILMGRFLCEVHKFRDIDLEAQFLAEIEQGIDSYVSRIIQDKGEILYKEPKPKQLAFLKKWESIWLISEHRGRLPAASESHC